MPSLRGKYDKKTVLTVNGRRRHTTAVRHTVRDQIAEINEKNTGTGTVLVIQSTDTGECLQITKSPLTVDITILGDAPREVIGPANAAHLTLVGFTSPAHMCNIAETFGGASGTVNINGRKFNAKQLHEMAIELQNDFVPSYVNLGRYREALLHDPTCVEAILNLAQTMDDSERVPLKVPLKTGVSSLSKEQMYQRVIELDPGCGRAHYNLGVLRIRHGVPPEQVRALFLRAIKCDPTIAWAYTNLANCLKHDETVSLPACDPEQETEQEELGPLQLVAHALSLKPGCPFTIDCACELLGGGASSTITVDGQELTKVDLRLRALEHQPDDADLLLSLVRAMDSTAKVLLPGAETAVGKIEIIRDLIDHGSPAVDFYIEYVKALGGVQIMHDGQALSAEAVAQLILLKALEAHPSTTSSDLFYQLALAVSTGSGTVTIPRLGACSRRRLLLKALELNPENAAALVRLALCLGTDTVHVPKMGVAKVAASKILLRAIEVDPRCAEAFVHLAITPPVVETGSAEVPGMGRMSVSELLAKSIELVPHSDATPYCVLGALMGPASGPVEIPGVGSLSKRDLLIRGIELRPNGVAYAHLGACLSTFDTVTLSDGLRWNQRQLYLKAIDLSPDFERAYLSLGHSMLPAEQIVLGEHKVSRRDLYLLGLKHCPKSAELMVALCGVMSNTETVELPLLGKLCKLDVVLAALVIEPSHEEAGRLFEKLKDTMPSKMMAKPVLKQGKKSRR